MRYAGGMPEDPRLMVRQQSLVKRGLRFKEIWPLRTAIVRGQCFERQQDRGLGVAARCGLLRKKRERKRLVAERLVARLESLALGRPRLSALTCANTACRLASCCPLKPTNAPAPAMRANMSRQWRHSACVGQAGSRSCRKIPRSGSPERSASRSRRSRFAASAASISASSACRSFSSCCCWAREDASMYSRT